MPADFENYQGNPCLIILDDLLNDVYSKDICDIFTKRSCHRNIRVILNTQSVYIQGRYCRDISLIATYILVLKNARDKKQFLHFARQVYPEGCDGKFRAFLDATERPHECMLLNISQDTDDRLSFRTCIFPSEKPSVMYADT